MKGKARERERETQMNKFMRVKYSQNAYSFYVSHTYGQNYGAHSDKQTFLQLLLVRLNALFPAN